MFATSALDPAATEADMAFPYDNMDPDEEVLLDLNPVFGRLFMPTMELILITGVAWILIGFIDGPYIGSGDLMGVRTVLLVGWVAMIAWRVGLPVLRWLRERTVVTDRRLLMRDGSRVSSVELRAIRSVDRKGSEVRVRAAGAPPIVLYDVPSARKISRIIDRRSRNWATNAFGTDS